MVSESALAVNSFASAFETLTPEIALDAVEGAIGRPLSQLLVPLPSYINRVYELQLAGGERLIAKFYRPGRWSRAAILEEHLFILDCAAMEIPVASPLRFPGGGTLQKTENGTLFALFHKRAGRAFELNEDEDYIRLGTLLARLHLAGERRPARFRATMSPGGASWPQIERLLESGCFGPAVRRDAETLLTALGEAIEDGFAPDELIRIHGDCHGNNVLNHPDAGLMLIDFDDMAIGPPIQDWWLLLPDVAAKTKHELALMYEGYTALRDFDTRQFGQIEILRAMRFVYYLDWCARQRGDYNFAERNPDWGSDAFWRRELAWCRGQIAVMEGK